MPIKLRLALPPIFVLPLLGAPALAQTGDNSVFIGQSGETNTITVNQDGNTNVVGGSAAGLALTQDGLDNSIAIDQTGFGNAIATTLRQGVRPSLGLVETGTGQSGNRNEIVVTQETQLVAAARNAIEAIFQSASALFDPNAVRPSNRLYLRQYSPGAPSGTRSVGQIVQINTSDAAFAGVTNSASIVQLGDASSADDTLTTAYQEGWGNSLTVEQISSGNRIGTARQIGTGNLALARQYVGGDNQAVSIDQIGDLNELRLTEDGARNYVEGIIQNNRGVAISGNRVTLTLGGDDNGGDGLGGAGSFALIPAGFLRFQAQVSQIGDDNGISYVTAADFNRLPLRLCPGRRRQRHHRNGVRDRQRGLDQPDRGRQRGGFPPGRRPQRLRRQRFGRTQPGRRHADRQRQHRHGVHRRRRQQRRCGRSTPYRHAPRGGGGGRAAPRHDPAGWLAEPVPTRPVGRPQRLRRLAEGRRQPHLRLRRRQRE